MKKTGRLTKKTQRLAKLDKLHVWHPFTQMRGWAKGNQLIIEKGEGNYLVDTSGNRYLDGVSSLWVTVHGHRVKEIDRAVKKQLDKIAHSTLLGLSNVPSIELAEKLVKIAPKGLKKVFYSDNGSTAVEIALKMSFQYWQQARGNSRKRKFISFTGAYHGDTFGAMSVGEIDVFVRKYRPLLFETLRAPYPYCYRCPVDKTYPECGTACLNELEKILKRHAEETAALIIEPLVQGAAGMVTSPPGFLKEVRRLTKKYGVHLIADEVATGFGRTGEIFACDAEGISPDFLCLAKGLTGGYMPLAATLTTDKVFKAFLGRYDEFKAFFHGHTYTGNPLGCAAALANIELLKRVPKARVEKKIGLFKDLLEELRDLPHVGDVRSRGFMAGVELVQDKDTKKPFPPKKRMGYNVCTEARTHGVIIRNIGDTVILMPPVSITDKEIIKLVRTTRDSIVKAI